MTRTRRATGALLVLVGAGLVLVTIVSLLSAMIIWLNSYTTDDDARLAPWLLLAAAVAALLSSLARLLYRRWFGVAAAAEDWLHARPS